MQILDVFRNDQGQVVHLLPNAPSDPSRVCVKVCLLKRFFCNIAFRNFVWDEVGSSASASASSSSSHMLY